MGKIKFICVIGIIAVFTSTACALTYKVKPGDYPGKLAQKFLGDFSLWPTIMKYNGLPVDSRSLPANITIQIPDRATAEKLMNKNSSPAGSVKGSSSSVSLKSRPKKGSFQKGMKFNKSNIGISFSPSNAFSKKSTKIPTVKARPGRVPSKP